MVFVYSAGSILSMSASGTRASGAGGAVGIDVAVGTGVNVGTGVAVGSGVAVGVGTGVLATVGLGTVVAATVGFGLAVVAAVVLACVVGNGVGIAVFCVTAAEVDSLMDGSLSKDDEALSDTAVPVGMGYDAAELGSGVI